MYKRQLAGGAASQAVGVATGIQSKFDFKGLALSAIGGGVSAGVGNLTQLSGGLKGIDKFLSSGTFASNVASGALGSAITQGVGVATGLQAKFSWAGVAAAGVGAGVSGVLGKELGIKPLYGTGSSQSLGNIAGNAFVGTASAIANAATRSALNGTSFGDNVMRALPDAIGQTVGGLVAEKIAGHGAPQDEIVINQDVVDRAIGNLPSSLPSTNIDLKLPPETRIALMESSGDISSASASDLRARLAEIKTKLRDDYSASHSSAGLGYVDVIDGGNVIDHAALAARKAGLDDFLPQIPVVQTRLRLMLPLPTMAL